MTWEGIITLVVGLGGAGIAAWALIRSNKATGTTSTTQHAITAADARAVAADARADAAVKRAEDAETRAAGFRDELTEVWAQMTDLRAEIRTLQERTTDQEQQLSWARGHIVYLESRIPVPPGAPPRPEGLRWPGYPTSQGSAS